MKKENFNKIFSAYLPEILLIAGALFCLVGELIASSTFNYFMIACVFILSVLILWKNKYLALMISALLGFSSFYLILALLSEFNKFPAGSKDGMIMLVTGLIIFGSLIILSFLLPRKYFKIKISLNDD